MADGDDLMPPGSGEAHAQFAGPLPRMEGGAAATGAVRIDQRADLAGDAGLLQRIHDELSLPVAIGVRLPVLDRAAAADAEIRAERFDALGARRIDAQEMAAVEQIATRTGMRFRMTEGNSCFGGGKAGVSDAYATNPDEVFVVARVTAAAVGTLAQIRERLDHFPASVLIELDRPSDLARTLFETKDVLGVDLSERGVVVRAKNPAAFYRELGGDDRGLQAVDA